MVSARYDTIGQGYAAYRREDPEIRARIDAALGDARTIANVGAGAGSYEPTDRVVLAFEPSEVMRAQRPPVRPAIRAHAADLPLSDGSVDAAMAILTIHHWGDACERGVRELRRVARGPVAILTYDIDVGAAMWLFDYLPEIAALDRAMFPAIVDVAGWLGGRVAIEPVLLSRDTPDWMLGSYWAHPERVLDAAARAATSGFALMAPAVIDRVVAAITRDLADGTWDRAHGTLRAASHHDVGLRLITALP